MDISKRLEQIDAAARRIKDYSTDLKRPERCEGEADFICRLVEDALSHLRTEPAQALEQSNG